MLRLWFLTLALFISVAQAEMVSDPKDPMVVYQVEDEFDWVKTSLKDAIAENGLKVSGELHISDMLQRTAKDLNVASVPYGKAESLEFCSSVVTHKLAAAHPANMVHCPLTVSLYTLEADAETVYVAFRRPNLIGDADEAHKALFDLLDSIARAAVE